MTPRPPHPQRCEMYAIADPSGNVMDETVVRERKKAIYNGFVWGRCGDDRTQKDFEKEGYRVIKVDVIPRTPRSYSSPAAAPVPPEVIRHGGQMTDHQIRSDIICLYPDQLEQIRQKAAEAARREMLDRLDHEIAIRENEMNRKGGFEDNLTTATGYYTSAGALNWVRVVLIAGLQESLRGEQPEHQP